MKPFQKILTGISVVILLSLLGGYCYFDYKFTPEKNYLLLNKQSGKIPITWLGTAKNALLVPIQFPGDPTTYYLQFDTGSPYTVFYSESVKNLKAIVVRHERAKTTFHVGNTIVSADKFKVISHGTARENGVKIIGTLGADVLENRKTIINFKENYLVFNLSKVPIEFRNKLFEFEFKKRKIILQGNLKGKQEKFLYDSGTSAYELLTSKEIWSGLKSPDSKIIIEKARSWQNVLTSYTAKCNSGIRFYTKELPLREVTYVEGFSQTQYLLMKYSGMTGMLGNKIFLDHSLYLDCSENKIGIE